MTHVACIIALFASMLFVASCSRPRSSQPETEARSVEQRVSDIEHYLNGNAPRMSEAEARKQYEHDLAEIRDMGLVDRAQRDIGIRLTNAIVEKWTIGYFRDTNTVWCDVRYRLPGGNETLQKEFGYTRKTGTKWSLIWGVGG